MREFEENVPEGRVERRFMSAEELAEVFACTALNFHPCEYDAYGMTVVEAASQGAPSVMHEVRNSGLLLFIAHHSCHCSVQAESTAVPLCL